METASDASIAVHIGNEAADTQTFQVWKPEYSINSRTNPFSMKEINKLYQQLLQPSDDLVSEIATLDGDILILGCWRQNGA